MPQNNNDEIDESDAAPHSQTNDSAAISTTTAEWYDLKTIADALGVTYSRLRGFADAEGVSNALGAKRQGGKGVRYPASALADFRHILAMQDAGQLTPRTAAARIRARRAEGMEALQQSPVAALLQSDNPPTPVAISVQPAPMLATSDALEALREHTTALRRHADVLEAAPAAEDKLIPADEAAELLACKPRSVRRYVQPALPGKWRRSDVLRFIEQLGRKPTEGA